MFHSAKPIFLAGRRSENLLHAGFRLDFPARAIRATALLRIAGRTFYRVRCNGAFVFHGPARSAHGTARVDEVDLRPYLVEGPNRIAIETASYLAKHWVTSNEPPFLQAEVLLDDVIVAATDGATPAIELAQRRRRVDNISHSRIGLEIHDLDPGWNAWWTADDLEVRAVEEIDPAVEYLPRVARHPDFGVLDNPDCVGLFSMQPDPDAEPPKRFYETPEYLENLGPDAERPVHDCVREQPGPFRGDAFPPERADGCYKLFPATAAPTALDFDFRDLESAFPGVEVAVHAPATVDLVFDEHTDAMGAVRTGTDMSMNSVVRLHLESGHYRFEAFEPYAIRYLRVIVRTAGPFQLHAVTLRRYQYMDLRRGSFQCSDGGLNRLMESARRTLILNTLDAFLDCPGRERGGWLCDSFWTARAAAMLLGDHEVERAMLEDFLHAPETDELGGNFPCAYPGETGITTPMTTWSMWLVLELAEYYRRTNDRDLVDRFRPRLDRFLKMLIKLETPEGLLANIPNNFVDWSTANQREHLYPVSVPANATYARMLAEMAWMYDNVDWMDKSQAIMETLRGIGPVQVGFTEPAFFPDALFHDDDGELRPRAVISEAAQYWIHWMGLVDEATAEEAIDALAEEMGLAPARPAANLYLGRANLFISQLIRLDLLPRWGRHDALLREMREALLPMIDAGCGTLWENNSDTASLCHGFMGHVGVSLMRDILGIGIPDEHDRTVEVAPHPMDLRWARGTVATRSGIMSVNWSRSRTEFAMNATVPGKFEATLRVPAEFHGWAVTLNGEAVENPRAPIVTSEPALQLVCRA